MKRIIRLTESELNRLIRKVVSEQRGGEYTYSDFDTPNTPPGGNYVPPPSAPAEKPAPKPYKPNVGLTTTLQRGSKGPEVSKYQLALLNLGFHIGGSKTPDGDFGPTTEYSVGLFQEKNGLPKTGKIDPATGDLLLQKMNAKNTGGQLMDKLGQATKLPPAAPISKQEINKPLPPEWEQDNREPWSPPPAGAKTTQPKLAGGNSNNMGGGGGWLTKKLSKG